MKVLQMRSERTDTERCKRLRKTGGSAVGRIADENSNPKKNAETQK